MYSGKIPPVAWAYTALVIAAILLPIAVGVMITKLYRVFHPIQKNQLQGLAAVGHSERDGFFKMVFIGWLICLPIYIVIYQAFAS